MTIILGTVKDPLSFGSKLVQFLRENKIEGFDELNGSDYTFYKLIPNDEEIEATKNDSIKYRKEGMLVPVPRKLKEVSDGLCT